MPRLFAEIADRYDALRPLQARDRRRVVVLGSADWLRPDDLVVEVGCGTGRITLPLAEISAQQVVGVDPEERMLEVARRKDVAGRVRWLRGTAYRLPLADGVAGAVLMSMVVHLLKQPGRAFAEARRVLRPQGRMVLWTFTPRHVQEFYLNEWFPSIARIDGQRFPSPKTLEAGLRRTGFASVAMDIEEETGTLAVEDVIDRVRGRYISTLSLVPPLEYRLGLQRLEELRTLHGGRPIPYRLEWVIVTATA
ncbi:MAG TPA: methyltransferase domain-containing protein [Candidatus Eisenbacteria bacterium]|jgi:ubiquinone/menaquinone biosynthesis C-methylase UbiE|nr:methyltransferase domain-containing protein [Candidatus Eisenbacteria bacterium]